MNDLTHASFFSGVGGLDLGLERAGWRTTSFSEIDDYASAVLAERWPRIPNLGDIVELARNRGSLGIGESEPSRSGSDWRTATLWSGGFPCQDLSVAGKRRGFAGERSSLAFAFLDLVESYRPPIILLENVPGLLSSHRGRDFGTLLDRLAELGYGWAYRILDARYFGVPQRRRRVFIVALRIDADDSGGRLAAERAAAVLSVGTRCGRHPATGIPAGEGTPEGARSSSDDIGGLTARGIDKNATQNVAAGHFFPTLDTSDGREGRDLPERYVLGERGGSGERAPDEGLQGTAERRDEPSPRLAVGDDQSVARAIHASTGRRSGPAGDEVSNLVHGNGLSGGPDSPISVASGLSVGDDGAEDQPLRQERGRRRSDARRLGDEPDPAGRESERTIAGDDLVSPPSDASRVRTADGLAGRLDDRVSPPLRAGGHGDPGIGRGDDEERLVLAPTLTAPVVKDGGRRDKVPVVLSPSLRVGAARIEDGGPGDTVPIVEQEAFGLSEFANYREGQVTLRANGGDVGGGSEAVIAATLNSAGNDGGFRTEPGEHLVFTKAARAQTDQDDESWVEGDVMPTLNSFDVGDARTTAAIIEGLPPGTSYDGLNQKVEHGEHRSIRIGRDSSDFVVPPGQGKEDDPLLPLGLDSHRYRCCGNGVVSSVAEWIGLRLREEALR